MDLRIYILGNTLFDPALRQISERFPDVDLALLHLGGTRLLGRTLTMDGNQGAQWLDLVRPRRVLPIHLDDNGPPRRQRRLHVPPPEFAQAANQRFLDHLLTWVPRGGTLELGR